MPKLKGTIVNSTFQGTNITSITDLGEITGITNSSNNTEAPFGYITTLNKVVIPDTLETFGAYVFYGCTSLSEINFPNAVKAIGAQAFYNCTSLEIEDLNLPNLETLGSDAFREVKIKKISNLGKLTALPDAGYGNYKSYGDVTILEEITIPGSVTDVPIGSFMGYSSLKKVSFVSIVSLKENAFKNCVSLTDIDLDKIGSIGPTCFSNCNNLPSILRFENLTGGIGNQAFTSNPNLTEIHAPLCTSVGRVALGNCYKLEYAELPSVLTIAGEAFNRCSKLRIVKFRDIQSFTGDVFFACSGLESVIIDNITPPSLSSNAFAAASSTFIIYVPDESVTAYREASGWSAYADRIKPLSEYVE